MTIDDEQYKVEEKILHILGIYPVISPTMLQSGLGPSTKPELWRPILTRLINEGKVIEDRENCITPTGRYNDYAKLMLPHTKVTVGHISGT